MKRLSALAQWFESRLGIWEMFKRPLLHPVPKNAKWWYVFGSATLTCLVLQVVTGILLALVYVPSADQAHASLEYLNYVEPLGWLIRAIHYYAATGMVVMMILHMTQVFLFGAYKYPRELTWVLGVILFGITLGLAFSGQVLRWDQDAYWGVGVAVSGIGRVPWIGPMLIDWILGGPIIGGSTLTRFFALHVFVLPALLFVFLFLHLQAVLKRGISEPPTPGKEVDPATYDEAYHEEVHKHGVPFFPLPVYRDLIFSGALVVIIVVVALIMGPFGPNDPPDPTLIPTNPRPDWYFLSAFALASLCPPELEAVALLGLPLMLFLVLLAVPFVAGRGERAPSRRPIAVMTVIVLFVSYGVLTWLGHRADWSPHMFAWSGTPVPEHIVKRSSPRQLQGVLVLQNKDCRNCHALDGQGGRRGPDLSDVGVRLTRDQLIRQVLQGTEKEGGNMPAYGKQLSPAEVQALVSFLQSCRPANQPPAEPAAPPPAIE
ncbi:MAG: hypothetical protein KatS3mg105_2992 [Gemmatales bacterium]|nr:MAG: hypothetical protein KatS3mg105_2992 [Gemmatales bacterium]